LFQKKDARKRAPEREQAKAFLMEVLRDGPKRTRDVQSEASEAGHSWVTVKRASVELGVEKTRVRAKKGKKAIEAWEWSLPDGLKWASG
jgi:putative DNA primase/helicase